MEEPKVFGTHEAQTLAQLHQVAERADRVALMADGLFQSAALPVVSEPVTIRASHVAFLDLFAQRLPTEIAARAACLAKVDALLAANVVELHNLWRQPDAAVQTRTVKCSV